MSDNESKPTAPDYIPTCPGCKGPMWHQLSQIHPNKGTEHYYSCPDGCHWRLCLLNPTVE